MGELKSTLSITVPVRFPASARVAISTGYHQSPRSGAPCLNLFQAEELLALHLVEPHLDEISGF